MRKKTLEERGKNSLSCQKNTERDAQIESNNVEDFNIEEEGNNDEQYINRGEKEKPGKAKDDDNDG